MERYEDVHEQPLRLGPTPSPSKRLGYLTNDDYSRLEVLRSEVGN